MIIQKKTPNNLLLKVPNLKTFNIYQTALWRTIQLRIKKLAMNTFTVIRRSEIRNHTFVVKGQSPDH